MNITTFHSFFNFLSIENPVLPAPTTRQLLALPRLARHGCSASHPRGAAARRTSARDAPRGSSVRRKGLSAAA